MPANKKVVDNIIDQLSNEITNDVGNIQSDELGVISDQFDKSLIDALKSFNSNSFDDDGFIKRMRDLRLDGSDKDAVKSVLNNVRADYINVETLNQSELLLRRDIKNICVQMPEMRDVIYLTRDSIIECNVASGEVSRSLVFANHGKNSESYESQVKELEERHNLLMAIKNFIITNTLQTGELYIHVVPYAKLFAELEMIKDSRTGKSINYNNTVFKESIPAYISESFETKKSLYNEANVSLLLESASKVTKKDVTTDYKIDGSINEKALKFDDKVAREDISTILKNIDIYNGSSELYSEMGEEGFREFIFKEYTEDQNKAKTKDSSDYNHFLEAISTNTVGGNNLFNKIDQEDIDTRSYNNIKGCYIKYLDPLKVVPIRMDRRVIGYYYVTTTMDMQSNTANPNGMIDLSFQHYTRDKNMVDQLANMIIRSFDKRMLENNIKLKNEIAEIIMAHKFSEGRLSFVYIPENEIIRLVINEDENGKGHSILEPTIFPARTYLMLNMYNILYTLNNNTTRIHYLKSSGLNKDYAAQIQRTMRKFQSRRITIDDIYSYAGVLNKIGGMGEMVLPTGRGDYKALETDTIEAVPNPINIEFLEQQRRQALSGTGAPNLLIINAIDEVDFAKTLELANARFLSTVTSYKIDFNRGITLFYQKLMKYSTDIEDDVIKSFKFKFNEAKQQDLVITSDMIQNFNSIAEVVESVYYNKNELEDKDGNPTPIRKFLRKELAKKYLPQLDYDELDEIVKKVQEQATDEELQNKVTNLQITDEDLKDITNDKE